MTIIIAFSTFSNIFLQSFYIDIFDNHLLQVSVLSFCFLISLLRFYNGDQIPEFYKFCIMVQEKILLKCFKRDLNAIFYWKLKAEKNHIMWEGNVQIDQREFKWILMVPCWALEDVHESQKAIRENSLGIERFKEVVSFQNLVGWMQSCWVFSFGPVKFNLKFWPTEVADNKLCHFNLLILNQVVVHTLLWKKYH